MAFPFQAIVLIGMSGVGKSHWAEVYGKDKSVSADEQIAERLLPDMAHAGIETTQPATDGLADFVGKFGAEKHGGVARSKFFERRGVYLDAERGDLLALPNHIANHPYSQSSLQSSSQSSLPLIYDTTGSFCEVVKKKNDPPYETLKESQACIVYLECSEREEEILLQRQMERPKPMVYDERIFEEWLREYRQEEEDIVPDDFLRFVFPKAITYRRARYEELADVTVTTAQLEELSDNHPSTFADAFLKHVENKYEL